MKYKYPIAILMISFTVICVSAYIIISENKINDLSKKLWEANWKPEISTFDVNGTIYYFVSIDEVIQFGSTEFEEAFEWARDFNEEWSWVWEGA